MKSFKNHCFMLTIMALSIFNTNFIHTEGDVEEPTISQSPSKIENEQQYKKYAEKILSIYSKPEEKEERTGNVFLSAPFLPKKKGRLGSPSNFLLNSPFIFR